VTTTRSALLTIALSLLPLVLAQAALACTPSNDRICAPAYWTQEDDKVVRQMCGKLGCKHHDEMILVRVIQLYGSDCAVYEVLSNADHRKNRFSRCYAVGNLGEVFWFIPNRLPEANDRACVRII
jgi:hypothetical protein